MANERQEFGIILIFTLSIPIFVTIIQLVIYQVQDFIGMSFYFISNIVPSIIAYSGVVVLQNIFAIATKKALLNVYTVLTFILLIIYSIFYAVHLSFTSYDKNKIALWVIPLSLLVMSVAIIILCVFSNFKTKYYRLKRSKRILSGEDY